MRYPKEFWLLFLLLDRCYTHCREDDPGVLLGALNPQIWADGLPADRADLSEWEDTHRDDDLRREVFINRIIGFLQDFGWRYGFDFSRTIVLLENVDEEEYAEQLAAAEKEAAAWCDAHPGWQSSAPQKRR